jgi:hypothetical protein
MSNPLEKALAQARQSRGWDKAPAKAEAEESEEKQGHSYSITCKGCNSVFQFSDEDLPNFRTDPETGSTKIDEDDDERDPDDDSDSDNDDDDLTEEEREEYAKDPKPALAASLIKAAKLNNSN